MLIATYSVASLGQFNMAWLALQAPVALIAGALSQVYLPRLSDTPPGEMTRVVVRVGGIALACSIPVFALLAWVSPALFPLVFGARWEAAGYFARSLAPWLALTVATSPLSNVFVATYHQRRMLAFACVYCAVPLTWLACSPYGVETTVAVLGALMAILLVGMLAMAFLTARAYDRGDGRARRRRRRGRPRDGPLVGLAQACGALLPGGDSSGAVERVDVVARDVTPGHEARSRSGSSSTHVWRLVAQVPAGLGQGRTQRGHARPRRPPSSCWAWTCGGRGTRTR